MNKAIYLFLAKLDTSEIDCEFQNEFDSWNDSVKPRFRILKKYPA